MALRPEEEVDDGYTRESFERAEEDTGDDDGDGMTDLEACHNAVLAKAWDLVRYAQDCGMVVTIDLKPRMPLAMGNYDMAIDVRPARWLS